MCRDGGEEGLGGTLSHSSTLVHTQIREVSEGGVERMREVTLWATWSETRGRKSANRLSHYYCHYLKSSIHTESKTGREELWTILRKDNTRDLL